MNTSDAIVTVTLDCPYCGERFETSIDGSAGHQHYIEDCYVCCRPIELTVGPDDSGNPGLLRVARDDD